jgi:site-specific DNA-methyltransferase (cytosine-N4-specific)
MKRLEPAYSTALGACFNADSLEYLRQVRSNSVSLVMTSPPFALRRKKAYGNVPASEYVEWFWPFAVEIQRILKSDGSFVLDLAGVWNQGSATRSLYQYELICRLRQIFHLAQEVYWYNPSKLPTPAEWVTIRRTRVKDAVNVLWWLSKTEEPQADNRRVLKPYSQSMKKLLRDGVRPKRRPSEHVITTGFNSDNGGAIPSNLLEIANTRSRDPYFTRCRDVGLPIHPARFPPAIPDFFIRLLTQPGQLVLDPFAGSNTTGMVAENLNRRWVAIELNRDYVSGSQFRFNDLALTRPTGSLAS